MKIILTDEELSLKEVVKSDVPSDSDDIQKFAKKGEIIQLTCSVTDEVIANTILNLLFKMSSEEESPIGLEMVSIATDANCITENTKKELVDLLDKCKAIITGDRTKELEELAGAIGGLGGMFGGISLPTPSMFKTQEVPRKSECISVELNEGEETNE